MAHNAHEKPRKHGCLRFFLVCAVLLLLARAALSERLLVREYTIASPLVTEEMTLVLLTDLHSTYYGTEQEALVSAIAAAEPDAILLGGDIADDKAGRQFGGAAALLDALAGAYPIYYVTGNHECWLDYTDNIHGLFADYGVTVLSDDALSLGGNIVLHGLDDPTFYGGDGGYREALGALVPTAGAFDILLAHRPEYAADYASAGFDLTLAGHAHGGQVRIPLLLNGLYAPNQGWLPPYAGGVYTINGKTLLVSRGLMRDDLPRICNRPELWIIQITGDGEIRSLS